MFFVPAYLLEAGRSFVVRCFIPLGPLNPLARRSRPPLGPAEDGPGCGSARYAVLGIVMFIGIRRTEHHPRARLRGRMRSPTLPAGRLWTWSTSRSSTSTFRVAVGGPGHPHPRDDLLYLPAAFRQDRRLPAVTSP